MKTVAIIQARLGSTRLPGKILLPLGTRTVLGQVIFRLQSCAKIDEVVVATTDLSSDDPVAPEAHRWNAKVFRGSENDVLARHYFAAKTHNAEIIVRVTSDCPLVDPKVLEQMLEYFNASQKSNAPLDFLANSLVKTFQHGLDVEIFTFVALERAFREATTERDREHASPYMRNPQNNFRAENFRSKTDVSSHRWTIDTLEDYELVAKIFSGLDTGKIFSTADVMEFLVRNHLLEQSMVYKPGTRERLEKSA
jgi:spore coat polysaccharide biosynthesis protein SpsF